VPVLKERGQVSFLKAVLLVVLALAEKWYEKQTHQTAYAKASEKTACNSEYQKHQN
jgi:hypothetical protein